MHLKFSMIPLCLHIIVILKFREVSGTWFLEDPAIGEKMSTKKDLQLKTKKLLDRCRQYSIEMAIRRGCYRTPVRFGKRGAEFPKLGNSWSKTRFPNQWPPAIYWMFAKLAPRSDISFAKEINRRSFAKEVTPFAKQTPNEHGDIFRRTSRVFPIRQYYLELALLTKLASRNNMNRDADEGGDKFAELAYRNDISFTKPSSKRYPNERGDIYQGAENVTPIRELHHGSLLSFLLNADPFTKQVPRSDPSFAKRGDGEHVAIYGRRSKMKLGIWRSETPFLNKWRRLTDWKYGMAISSRSMLREVIDALQTK